MRKSRATIFRPKGVIYFDQKFSHFWWEMFQLILASSFWEIVRPTITRSLQLITVYYYYYLLGHGSITKPHYDVQLFDCNGP